MKIVVAYLSRTGKTVKVAAAMAGAVGARVEPIGELRGKVEADLLFVGGAVYADRDHGLDPALTAFVRGLDPARVGRVVFFCTGFSDAAVRAMRQAAPRGLAVEGESFSCKGSLFIVFNFGHPDGKDLEAAAAFARRMADRVAGTKPWKAAESRSSR